MYKITETKVSKRNIYNAKNIIDGNVIEDREGCIQIFSSKHYDKTYYTMYNSKMEIIEEMWNYINYIKDNLSENSKIKLLYNLKFIYIFCELFKKNIKNLETSDFILFANFLAGHSYDDNMFQVKVKKHTKERVNKILRDTKSYLKQCGFRKSYNALDKCPRINFISKGSTKKTHYEDRNYITTEEYISMIDYISKDDTINDLTKLKYRVIIRIMFEAGLRCGETLGLTFEDFIEDENKHGPIGIIIVRNRASDSYRQRAKCCSNIKSQEQYKDQFYGQENVDYQLAFMNIEIYEELETYIELAHGRAMENENYCKSKADNISDNSFENHYVFLNDRVPTPLSYMLLNNYLKKMFTSLEIPTTPHLRVNYAHRFRHGFIIDKLYNENLDSEQVIQLSRHRTVEGLVPYKSLSYKEIGIAQNKLQRYLEGKK